MKSTIKALAQGIATLLVLPAFILYSMGRVCLGTEKAFQGWSQFFSLFPGLTGVYLRHAFYRLALHGCGRDACFSFGTVFSHPTAHVGNHVYVGLYCGLGDVTLEDDVLIASQVSIANGCAQHGTKRLDIPIREQPGIWPRITIGRDSWIGERAVILADVGQHCVIGAGSVVSKSIPDYAIALGNPARVVRFRNSMSGDLSMRIDDQLAPQLDNG